MGKTHGAGIVWRQNFIEHFIELADERGRGAEVGCERREVEDQRIVVVWNFQPNCFDAGKEFGVGVTERIDGLHRIADDEAGAADPLGPCSDEA